MSGGISFCAFTRSRRQKEQDKQRAGMHISHERTMREMGDAIFIIECPSHFILILNGIFHRLYHDRNHGLFFPFCRSQDQQSFPALHHMYTRTYKTAAALILSTVTPALFFPVTSCCTHVLQFDPQNQRREPKLQPQVFPT